MAILLSYRDVKRQSETVLGQFREKWLSHSRENASHPNRKDCEELRLCGLGKVLVVCAMGESLEDAIPVIRKYRERCDVMACDKTFGPLLDAGITPDFVQICDANIPYSWLEKWVEKTRGVKLIATAYANVDWTRAWKGPIYFYLNRDAIDSQKEFSPIMGAKTRTIPAGSNVSNALVIFMLGVDETSQGNWAGYEQYLLTGYDYSWRPKSADLGPGIRDGKYYAFNDPRPKRWYMQHRTLLDMNRDIVHTSENLLFSAKWLFSYVTNYNLPVVNCSNRGLLDIPLRANLEDVLSRVRDPSLTAPQARSNFEALTKSYEAMKAAEKAFMESRRAVYASR